MFWRKFVQLNLCFIGREERYEFIRAKYVDKKFAVRTSLNQVELQSDLERAVTSRDIQDVLQAFVEGADLGAVLPHYTVCATNYYFISFL